MNIRWVGYHLKISLSADFESRAGGGAFAGDNGFLLDFTSEIDSGGGEFNSIIDKDIASSSDDSALEASWADSIKSFSNKEVNEVFIAQGDGFLLGSE